MPAVMLLPVICVLLAVLAWLVWRGQGYKRSLLDRPPAPDWVATAESFVDPASGEVAQVWTHPSSGERAYVRRGWPARAG